MSAGGSTRAIVAALFANLGIAIAKFVGFIVTGSASMLAESVHSGADTTNQVLLLWGGRQARREPTAQHPFGFGRERYFWSFVVAVVLFALGSVFAIFEGIDKIRHPHELESLAWAIGILVFGIFLEGFSLRTAIVESARVKGDIGWIGFIRRSRSPELPVVLLEDTGAMIGLVLALTAVLLADITGNAVFDGIGTLAIGILLGFIAVILAIEMKSLLVGEAAIAPDRRKIVDAIESTPSVDRIIHMRTQHIGPEELLVAGKIHFAGRLSNEELTDAIDAAENAIRDAVPIARLIYLEPDFFEDDYVRPTGDDDDHG
ncbi:MAG: cation diffusion facilitator family transporter [Acidimicrobiia bacterium]|nr:cation diffusion facilitator family transporter [Acidimicrobiia bacterium]